MLQPRNTLSRSFEEVSFLRQLCNRLRRRRLTRALAPTLARTLPLPPTPGLLEFGGKVAGFARVLRADKMCDTLEGEGSASGKQGVALQFCRPPKLCL